MATNAPPLSPRPPFLRLDGQAVRPDPFDGVRAIEALASGEISEGTFAAWLTALMMPIDDLGTGGAEAAVVWKGARRPSLSLVVRSG